MMKLALVIDKAITYVEYERDKVLKSWDVTSYEREKNLSNVGEATIFGPADTSVLHLTDINSVKKTVDDLQRIIDNDEAEKKFSSGLVITTIVARNSTKKLEKLVSDLGGKVIVAKENSKDKTNVSEKILNDLNLQYDVRKFLVDYSADDYDSIINVVRNISSIPFDKQRFVSIEDVVMRMPQPPGSIPPWEIEKPIMAGDANKTIELFRRINYHSHYLVVLSVLKNKFLTSWRISGLLATGNYSLASAAEALGVANNYPFKLAYNTAKSLGVETLTFCVKILADTEMKVKGGSSADSIIHMELALVQIANKLRR